MIRSAKAALVPSFQRPALRVAIRSIASYEQDLAALINETVGEFDLPIRGKIVLLKPNFVGPDPLGVTSTHPAVIAAARESLLRLGAAQVLIGEGPAMDRDRCRSLQACFFSTFYPPRLKCHQTARTRPGKCAQSVILLP